MRKLLATLSVLMVLFVSGCDTSATVASRNLSKAAEEFQLDRRIVFYNGITGDYMLSIEGRCSLEPGADKVMVTCKDGEEFKKHYLGLSDNVTYFSEQLKSRSVSVSHYKVIFKPSVIIPDIDLK